MMDKCVLEKAKTGNEVFDEDHVISKEIKEITDINGETFEVFGEEITYSIYDLEAERNDLMAKVNVIDDLLSRIKKL